MNKNFAQGQAVSERETCTDWGGPDTSISPLPLDQHHTRRSYVGFGEFPRDARRELAKAGDELERTVINLSAPQIVHGATRSLPGQHDEVDSPGRTSGKIRAVHTFSGARYAGPAAKGYDRYVGVRALLPSSSAPCSGFDRTHELSHHDVAGTTIINALEQS